MQSRRTRILLAVLVVASLTLVILSLRGGQGPLGSVRSAGATVLGGFEKVAATVFSPITRASSWWSSMRDQAAQIDTLSEDNSQLRSELQTLTNDKARAAALDGLLRVSSVGGYRFVPAEVIAVGPAQDFAWTVTIDAGRNDGIQPDMTVINGDGLVGRVLRTTATTSTVVLIVDESSAVGGRIAATQEIGIVAGTGRQDELEFQLLDPMADVRIGDALVTFGSKSGRPFAPGLPIGQVVELVGTPGQLTRVARVRPYMDASTLSVVGVVTRPPREDPRDSVLPKGDQINITPEPAPLGGPEATAAPSPAPSPSPGQSAGVEQEKPAKVQPRDASPSPSGTG